MSADYNHRELHELVSRFCDGELQQGPLKRLDEILRTDAEARRFYYHFTELHGELAWNIGTLSTRDVPGSAPLAANIADAFLNHHRGSTTARISSSKIDLPRSRILRLLASTTRYIRSSSIVATLLIATVVYGSFGLMVWQMGIYELAKEDEAQFVAATSERPVARLVSDIGCRWEEGETAFRNGDVLPPRLLRLVSGIAEIEFNEGASTSLEGPCEFTLVSAGSGFLRYGKLLAKVPPRATGFTVNTPTVGIVDLGTEFGVEVSSTGKTAIQVFQGKVDVEPHHDAYIAIDQHQAQGRQRLVAGQSSVIASTLEGIHSGPTAAFRDFLRRVQAEKGTAANDKELVIASDVESGAIGNQGDLDGKVVGMDFDVLEPIEIQRLGVFDSGSDGIDPSSQLIVGIWSRDMLGTPADPSDDQPGKRLARQKFSTESPGQLIGGNRFKPLESPLRLEHGTYSLLAWGFNRANLSARLIVGSEGETLSASPAGIPPTPRASLQESWIGIVGPLPVFGATDSSHYWNRTATQLINGATSGNGMVGRRLEMANSDCNKMWHTEGKLPVTEENVVFDLTGESGVKQHIAIAKIWNYHEHEGAAWLTTSRGVKEVTIQHSLDGNTWLDVINPATNTRIFQLTKAPDKAEYGEDLADVLSLGAGGIDTRYVRIKIESKLDSKSSYLGLSEVRFFDGNPVTRRWVLNDGSGRLLFLPWARISPQLDEFPSNISTSSRSSRFLAGTFEFSAAVKPATGVRKASQRNSP